MHQPGAEGVDFFVCDFCRSPWREDRPMVEGHRGALICGQCLRVAYTELVLHERVAHAGMPCVMCLETRDQTQWQSPLHPEARACLRCVKQAAGVLSKDAESGWTRPVV